MLRINIHLGARINSLFRNLSRGAAFHSRYLTLLGDNNALQLSRNDQGWSSSYLCTRNLSSVNKPHIVEMRGLDVDATEEDVVGFFASLNILPSKVSLRYDPSGRVAGMCEVEFSTYAEAVIAMRKKNAFIGNHFIRLKLRSSDVDEIAENLKANDSRSPGDTNLPDAPRGITKNLLSTGHFVRMKGVPRRITEQAIYDFFWPVNVRPICVKQVLDDHGRPTSEFDIEFLTHEEAARAMDKNNEYFGRQFVELTLKSTSPETHHSSVQTSAGISNPGVFEKQNIGLQNIKQP